MSAFEITLYGLSIIEKIIGIHSLLCFENLWRIIDPILTPGKFTNSIRRVSKFQIQLESGNKYENLKSYIKVINKGEVIYKCINTLVTDYIILFVMIK